MLSNILNDHSEIDIMPEIHFMNPAWVHKDFISVVNKRVGDLREDRNIHKLINLMFSKELYGIFWENVELDRNILKEKIMISDRSFKSILKIILMEHCQLQKKVTCGAKFPVHFSKINILLEWFPECKIIHTVRDIRAIYSSQANKYILNPDKLKYTDRLQKYQTGSTVRDNLLRLVMFLFISLQFSWASWIHEKVKNLDNYKLVRYEDMVLRPEENLDAICDFLKINSKKEMLYPAVVNSTYMNSNTVEGFQRQLVYKWKDYLSPITSKFLMFFNRRGMRRFGYLKSYDKVL